MVLNVDKTECMLLGTVKRLNSALMDFSVGENEYIIKPVNMHKLLGLHIDNTLSWTTNVSHICSKLRSRLPVQQDKESHTCICQEAVFWWTGTACHRIWVCDMSEWQPWSTIKGTQNSKIVPHWNSNV